jgi:hypothetical protein
MSIEITPDFYASLVNPATREASEALLRANGQTVPRPGALVFANEAAQRQAQAHGTAMPAPLFGQLSLAAKEKEQARLQADYISALLSRDSARVTAAIKAKDVFTENEKSLKNDANTRFFGEEKRSTLVNVMGGLSAFAMVVPALGQITGATAALSGILGTEATLGSNVAQGAGKIGGTIVSAPVSGNTSSLFGNIPFPSSAPTSIFDKVAAIAGSPIVSNLKDAGSAIGTALTVKSTLDQNAAFNKSISDTFADLSSITNPGLPNVPPANLLPGKNTVITDTSKDSAPIDGGVLAPITVSASPVNNSMILLIAGLLGGFYFLNRR